MELVDRLNSDAIDDGSIGRALDLNDSLERLVEQDLEKARMVFGDMVSSHLATHRTEAASIGLRLILAEYRHGEELRDQRYTVQAIDRWVSLLGDASHSNAADVVSEAIRHEIVEPTLPPAALQRVVDELTFALTTSAHRIQGLEQNRGRHPR